MDKRMQVRDVQFPGPTNKIVVFKEVVFKLKYKLSEHSIAEVPVTAAVQADIGAITAGVLAHLLSSQTVVPLKNDYMVVYPGLAAWTLVENNQLLFFYNGRNLQPHPQAVYLLIHLFATPPPAGERSQVSAGVKRPHLPDEMTLPVDTGIPRSEYIVRKKLRVETPPLAHLCEAEVPNFFSSALPIKHAQTTPKPSLETVSKVAITMKSDFEQLCQPTVLLTKESSDKKEKWSIGTLFSSIKSLFGWT